MRALTVALFFLSLTSIAQTTCLDPLACNFTEIGDCVYLDIDGLPCVSEGCAIPGACNFDPEADINDGSCEFTSCLGCTDLTACNYEPEALYLDLSCIYYVDCNGVCGGDWIEDECGNCFQPIFNEEVIVFNYTGAIQTYVVPAGVTSLTIEAWGAEGGESDCCVPAGQGGYAKGELAVTSGQTVNIYVGGQGDTNISYQTVSSGGWNGGGDGFGGWDFNFVSGNGTSGGGGGASDVRAGGTTLYDRVIVAGGGGGSDSYEASRWGGDGGGLSGSTSGGGAAGGTQTSGGSYSDAGTNGVFGIGGAGYLSSSEGHGTGGGGGYYGGGGGQHNGAGGGGGSSYIGGVTNGLTTSGVNSGDGLVIISWEGPLAPVCVLGCVVEQACNYNPEATNDDGSCAYPDDCGICGGDNSSCLGCTVPQACNFDSDALIDDGSCDFCFCGPGTAWDNLSEQCLIVEGSSDIDGDGCTNLSDLLDLLSDYGICDE